MNIKKLYCALGLPVRITNADKSISAVIELNKNDSVVCTYYKVGDKEYPDGNSVYLHDVSSEFLKSCHPASLCKKYKFKKLLQFTEK